MNIRETPNMTETAEVLRHLTRICNDKINILINLNDVRYIHLVAGKPGFFDVEVVYRDEVTMTLCDTMEKKEAEGIIDNLYLDLTQVYGF
jgi:hypothetical protein